MRVEQVGQALRALRLFLVGQLVGNTPFVQRGYQTRLVLQLQTDPTTKMNKIGNVLQGQLQNRRSPIDSEGPLIFISSLLH